MSDCDRFGDCGRWMSDCRGGMSECNGIGWCRGGMGECNGIGWCRCWISGAFIGELDCIYM